MSLSNEIVVEQELNSRLERIFTGPHVSMVPGDEASIKISKPSKRKPMLGGKGILIFAMLGLATGIAVAAAWSWPHSLIDDLKSYKRGVVETIFAVTSKGQGAVQVSAATPDVTARDVSEILNRLDAIDRGLSSMQQNVNELAAGQAQIRKEQLDLAVLQARLVAKQTIANAKQNKQSTPDPRFYRRDYR